MSKLTLSRRARLLLSATTCLWLLAGWPANAGEKKPERVAPPFDSATELSECSASETLMTCSHSVTFDPASNAVKLAARMTATGRAEYSQLGISRVDFSATDRLPRSATGYTYSVRLKVNDAESEAKLSSPCPVDPYTLAYCSVHASTALSLQLSHSTCADCQWYGSRVITEAQEGGIGTPGQDPSHSGVQGSDVVLEMTMLNRAGGPVPRGDVTLTVTPFALVRIVAHRGTIHAGAASHLDAVVLDVRRVSL